MLRKGKRHSKFTNMMTRAMYETLPLSELKQIAKVRKMKGVSTLKKSDLIDRMLEEDQKDESEKAAAAEPETMKPEIQKPEVPKAEPQYGTEPKAETQHETEPKAEPASKETEEGTDNSGEKRIIKSGTRRMPKADRTDRAKRPERTDRSERAERPEKTDRTEKTERPEKTEKGDRFSRPEEQRYDNKKKAEPDDFAPRMDISELDSGIEVRGILEVMPEGYGFIRSDNFLPGENDVYVSPSQIRKFGFRTGDILVGNTRIKSQNEKFSALLYVKTINDLEPAACIGRMNFENMTPIFPDERIHLEREGGSLAMRIVDLISPIGKGQRGMIVSPPKAGKTTLLKDAAKSILRNNPEMHLIILLIDERPEEVTDMKETVKGPNVEVIYSTFDEMPEHHKRVSEMVIERAKRLVENKRDVVIFIDSITRLARAYNQVVPPSGRTLSGGLDPAALHMPKRFFGAARNMREGGSLTILATALVDTGSKMDDVVYEEFKGTGNMELILDRKLQERRVFPAIDISKSGTRREDLLLTANEQEVVNRMRRALNGMRSEEAAEKILSMFAHTRTNEDLIRLILRQKMI